jgi:hypothetical protein
MEYPEHEKYLHFRINFIAETTLIEQFYQLMLQSFTMEA